MTWSYDAQSNDQLRLFPGESFDLLARDLRRRGLAGHLVSPPSCRRPRADQTCPKTANSNHSIVHQFGAEQLRVSAQPSRHTAWQPLRTHRQLVSAGPQNLVALHSIKGCLLPCSRLCRLNLCPGVYAAGFSRARRRPCNTSCRLRQKTR